MATAGGFICRSSDKRYPSVFLKEVIRQSKQKAGGMTPRRSVGDSDPKLRGGVHIDPQAHRFSTVPGAQRCHIPGGLRKQDRDQVYDSGAILFWRQRTDAAFTAAKGLGG